LVARIKSSKVVKNHLLSGKAYRCIQPEAVFSKLLPDYNKIMVSALKTLLCYIGQMTTQPKAK